jgi:hypothetical protein
VGRRQGCRQQPQPWPVTSRWPCSRCSLIVSGLQEVTCKERSGSMVSCVFPHRVRPSMLCRACIWITNTLVRLWYTMGTPLPHCTEFTGDMASYLSPALASVTCTAHPTSAGRGLHPVPAAAGIKTQQWAVCVTGCGWRHRCVSSITPSVIGWPALEALIQLILYGAALFNCFCRRCRCQEGRGSAGTCQVDR